MQGYSHAFQSTSFTVQEFREGSLRLLTHTQSLAEKLNSRKRFSWNENFQPELNLIRVSPSDCGKRKEKLNRKKNMKTLLKVKQSNVRIENKDQLCCECTIVTMRNRLPIDENVDGKRMCGAYKPSLISSKTKNSIWRSTSGASTYVFLESKK